MDREPPFEKLVGLYLGKVIQHCSHGYCKIFIPSVHQADWEQHPELLPVATQATSIFGGDNNGNGLFTYPNIGSIVYVLFLNGDQNIPVYFASALGGQNAFGQYELIKQQNEEISKKHLLTSGKTHIQWNEDGILSVQVEDPDRREAQVDYNNLYHNQISDDHVSCRPVVEKVDSEELSNIHCKLVLNNDDGTHGSSLLETHYLDKVQLTDTSAKYSLNSNLTTDNDFGMDNDGNIYFDQLSSGLRNYVDMNAETTETVNTESETKIEQQIPGKIILEASHTTEESYTQGTQSLTAIVRKEDFKSDKTLERGFENQININYVETIQQGSANSTKTVLNNLTADFLANEAGDGKSEIHVKNKVMQDNAPKVDCEIIDSMDTSTSKIEKRVTNNLVADKCENKILMDSSGGELEITITDLKTRKKCSFIMHKDGTASFYGDTELTVTCPLIHMNGAKGATAVDITGTLLVTGNITSKADVIASGCTLNTHVHPYVDSGGWIGSGITKPGH